MPLRRRASLVILPAAIVVAGATAAALVWWYMEAHSQKALRSFRYLPPDSTMAINLDLAGLRNNSMVRRVLDGQTPPQLEREYAEFVRATGFDFERDLDSVSLGISGPEGARVVHAVLQGRFDQQKVEHYSRQHRQDTSTHLGRSINLFTGPSGRPFRLAFLAPGRVAFSNAPDRRPIEKMVELAERSAPDLEDRLRELPVLEHLPEGSQMWVAVDLERAGQWRMPAPVGSGTSLSIELLRGSRLGLLAVRIGEQQVDFHMVAECDSGAGAQEVARSLAGLRALLVALAQREEGSGLGAELASALKGISIEVEKNAAVVRWRLEAAWLERLLRESGSPRPPSHAAPAGKATKEVNSEEEPGRSRDRGGNGQKSGNRSSPRETEWDSPEYSECGLRNGGGGR